MAAQYEYIYENVPFIASLQDWMDSGRAYPQLAGLTIVGAYSDNSGYASIIFTTQLTTTQRNRLTTFIRNQYTAAVFVRMETVQDNG